MEELQKKIDRLMKRYEDHTAPIESRHTLDLIADITDAMKDLDERLAIIEGRVDYIANKTA